ncbi:kinase-like domain-containing protein [Macrophomina phaseolina]|uniref:Kinase-like domain-containing protein n=1 Tax=Macrophomina phaseolina TaxID=35725 RepID=A0ABQ8GPC1_9PEZI|nr:kinase-like domain-containing protein [Macrophomina phaseolina]
MSAHGARPKWTIKNLNPRRKRKELSDICEKTSEDLWKSMCHRDDAQRRFVLLDDLRRIWGLRDGAQDTRLDRFRKLLASLERDPGIHDRHLKLLSILVWISYASWREFARAFPTLDDPQNWNDDTFTFKDPRQMRSLFESQVDDRTYTDKFCSAQFAFSPAPIVQMQPSDFAAPINAFAEGTRFAFLEGARTLHHGTHPVTKHRVAAGGLVQRTGDPIDVVAVKTFSPAQEWEFKVEVQNLKKMGRVASPHANIQYCFSAIQIGAVAHLIFQAAECNLSQILHWRGDQFANAFGNRIKQHLRPSYLLWEARDIRDALQWLHSGFSARNSLDRYRCYHLDFKPDNILVFAPGHSDQEDDIWIWKIADFGRSVIENTSGDWASPAPNGSSAVGRSARRLRTGVYQAPEVESHEHDIGTAADIWSFGCVLLEILVFAHRGPDAVKELEKARNNVRNKPHFYDASFQFREDVKEWLDNLRLHDEGLQELWSQVRGILRRDPRDRPGTQELEQSLYITWSKVKTGQNELIFPPRPETPSTLGPFIPESNPGPIAIHIKEYPQEIEQSAHELLQKRPSDCRVSTTGDCAIFQVNSKQSSTAYRAIPKWTESSDKESCCSLAEEDGLRDYKVKHIAAEGIFCVALICHVKDWTKMRLLLYDRSSLNCDDGSPPVDLSISTRGDCIVHFEDKLRVFHQNLSQEALLFPGKLKKAFFSRNGKWIYIWSRSRLPHGSAVDRWTVFEVASDGSRLAMHCRAPFVSLLTDSTPQCG